MTVRGNPSVGAFHLAHGHALMIPAILASLVAYLIKNKSASTALLAEINQSSRLGSKIAAWLEENEVALCRNLALQSRGWGAAAYEESIPARGPQPKSANAFGDVPGSSPADVSARKNEYIKTVAASQKDNVIDNRKVLNDLAREMRSMPLSI